MKYKDWLDVWFANYIEPSSKTKTCERYSEIIEKHLKVKLGEYELEELSPIVIQKYITELMQSGNLTTGKGLAANSVNGIITVIQNSLKLAYTLGELKEYTTDKIKRPKTKEKEVSCFTLAEQKKIEQAALSNNDFDRNLVNLFRCMKERTLATVRELGFCNLNSREDFNAIRKFFEEEKFDDKYFREEEYLTELLLPPLQAEELKELRTRITEDYDVRRAAMFLKLLRYSYSSSCKSYASQPFDIRKLFSLIKGLENRLANVVIENQDFERLINHYDRGDSFFYADPPYYSTEDMYAGGFGREDHVRLRNTLSGIKGKFLLSYNDCEEIRELYEDFSILDFTRTHSMAQRYEAGKEFKELLIGNYDLYERERKKPRQLNMFSEQKDFDYKKILRESIIACRIKK